MNKPAKHLLFCFFCVISTGLYADDKPSIAIVEFQNRSEGAMKFNGSELAVWIGKELKDTGEYKICDRKAVARIVKDASWDQDRLSTEDEAKLKQLPAQYALYGSLQEWRTSLDSTTPNPYSQRGFKNTNVPAAVVVYSVELVDLNSGKAIKTFNIDGAAIAGTRGMGAPDDRRNEDFESQDELFEEASQSAMRRAADLLTGEDD